MILLPGIGSLEDGGMMNILVDRISHALAHKVRVEAGRRGLPLLFQRRGGQNRTAAFDDLDPRQTRNNRRM